MLSRDKKSHRNVECRLVFEIKFNEIPISQRIDSPLQEDARLFGRLLDTRFAYYYEGDTYDPTYLVASALSPETCQYLNEAEIRSAKRIILSEVKTCHFFSNQAPSFTDLRECDRTTDSRGASTDCACADDDHCALRAPRQKGEMQQYHCCDVAQGHGATRDRSILQYWRRRDRTECCKILDPGSAGEIDARKKQPSEFVGVSPSGRARAQLYSRVRHVSTGGAAVFVDGNLQVSIEKSNVTKVARSKNIMRAKFRFVVRRLQVILFADYSCFIRRSMLLLNRRLQVILFADYSCFMRRSMLLLNRRLQVFYSPITRVSMVDH